MNQEIASPVTPDLRSLLNNHKQEVMQAINCHLLGEIVSYDGPKATCTVKVLNVRQVGGQLVEYPLLTDCPVFQLMGGEVFVSMPVAAGDPCLVLFNDVDMDNWFTSGGASAPNSNRSHSLSDGLVLVGFRYSGNPPPLSGGNSAYIYHKGTGAQLSIGSTAGITKGSQAVQLLSNGKLHLANSSADNFRTAMDSLFTALTAWVNTGGSTPNPATVTAISNAKTAFGAIFE